MKTSWLKKMVTVGAAVFLSSAIGTASVNAAAPNVEVKGGNLEGGSIKFPDFGSITLNGKKQTLTGQMAIGDIVDASGKGYGWHLSLTMSPFQIKGDDEKVSKNDPALPTGALVADNNIVIKKKDPTSSDASKLVISPKGPLDTGNPINLISAPKNEGMGSYTVKPLKVKLTIPASAYAGTYTSTATVQLTTGP